MPDDDVVVPPAPGDTAGQQPDAELSPAALAVAKARAAAQRAAERAAAARARADAEEARRADAADAHEASVRTWSGPVDDVPVAPAVAVGRDDDALATPGTVRDVAELPDPVQVAREALARAKLAARERGLRPGMQRRRVLDDAVRSGPRKDGRDPQLLASATSGLVRDRGWAQAVSVGGVVGRWREIAGDQVADHCEPVTFQDRVLVVQASSTAWATQLTLLTPTILAKIAEAVGDGVVDELHVRGPVGRSFVKGPRRVPGRGPRDTWG